MRRTLASASFGPLLLSMLLVALTAFTPALAAQTHTGRFYSTLCRYQGQLDGHPIVYVVPILRTDFGTSDVSLAFNKYIAATYDISKVQYGNGYCRTVSDQPEQQAYTMQQVEQQWAASKAVVTHINWSPTDSAVTMARTQAVAPGPAQMAAAATASSGGPFIMCATSGGAGIDTYLTGAFQTTRVKRTPSGGNLVDQAILDHFYAYLTQKGYKFKPGSNYGCAVKPTEAEARADEQKRQSGCSTCGKIVETGWKE